MKVICRAFLIFCLSAFANNAQTQDLSGQWTGQLQQNHKSWSFIITMDLVQQGTVVEGTIKSLSPQGSYSLINIKGSVNGSEIIFEDVSVIEETLSSGLSRLCIKNYKGRLITEQNKPVIEGNWENNGTKSFGNGRYYENNFTCFPGVFRLEKTMASAPPVSAVQMPKPEASGVFLNRKIEVQKFLEISSDTVQLIFYDNGMVDEDTISVYLNKEPLITKQRLTANALSIPAVLKPGADNEIIMFAENVGSIPPNTALLVFFDGGKRYEVTIGSDTGKSGTIILRNTTPAAK